MQYLVKCGETIWWSRNEKWNPTETMREDPQTFKNMVCSKVLICDGVLDHEVSKALHMTWGSAGLVTRNVTLDWVAASMKQV